MIEQLREAVEAKTGQSSVEIPRDDLRQLLAIAAERDALREALEKVEPLINAQFEGHADVAEFMEKARKLNEALDVVRAALERPE